jgi:hypothetical protein
LLHETNQNLVLPFRVARWYIFKPKIPFWLNFGGSMYVAMGDIGTFYGHLVYFMVIWYIFPVLVCCAIKNLATLLLVLSFLKSNPATLE